MRQMKKLLVIDDSRGVRTFLERELTPHFAVSLAEDGQDGLEMACHGSFDLVLSDINMPHLSGFELHTELKLARPAQKIALMTDASIDRYLPDALDGDVGNILAKATFKHDLGGAIRLLHDLENRELFGMTRRLGAGGEVRTFVVNSEHELPDILIQCHGLLNRFPRREIYQQLLPELVRNAFVHGKRPMNGTGHSDRALVYLSVGADWQRVGLGVSDPGGTLTFRQAMQQFIDQSHTPSDEEASSRGKGLGLVRQTMHQMLITLCPSKKTEVLAFDYLQAYRGPRSLHINELSSTH